MNILIVDDEPLARAHLRRMIETDDQHQVCGEAGNGAQALSKIVDCEVDVVLLDIRMPGMDGLEVARHLTQLKQVPAVIFTTAYNDHALAAFEAHALDYLLKPVRQERLLEALAQVSQLNRVQARAVLQDIAGRSQICVRWHGDLHLVPLSDIRCFRAEQKYVVINDGEHEYLLEESLKSLEAEFSADFIRIHRNALVSRHWIERLERDEKGQQQICLRGIELSLEVSRRHLGEVRDFIKGD
ncbi:MAG: response regulator transcription factor [Gammaproteobacteria bacterium]|nr:response regulator transcription factor [Gammaproteobacteria bacterium]